MAGVCRPSCLASTYPTLHRDMRVCEHRHFLLPNVLKMNSEFLGSRTEATREKTPMNKESLKKEWPQPQTSIARHLGGVISMFKLPMRVAHTSCIL